MLDVFYWIPRRAATALHDQRHPGDLVIETVRMFEPSVVSDRLTVVRGDDHHHLIPLRVFLQSIEESPELSVEVAEFGVVQSAEVCNLFSPGYRQI